MYTFVEDVIEILVGATARKLNIRLAPKDRTTIKSIYSQISSNVGLTDAQLKMVLNKFEKYRGGLEANSVDVNQILKDPLTRIPLRFIDRTNSVSLIENHGKNKKFIIFKHQKNNEIMDRWRSIEHLIVGNINDIQINYAQKIFPAIDINFRIIFENFRDFELKLSEEVEEIFKKYQDIIENKNSYQPTLIKKSENYEILNSKHDFHEIFQENDKKSWYTIAARAKEFGIAVDESVFDDTDSLTKLSLNILKSKKTRIRITPDDFTIKMLLDSIFELDQLPLLISMDTDNKVLDQVTEIFEAVKDKIPSSAINVFFRLPPAHEKSRDFADFVKKNQLNNYIDQNTKLVFVDKHRISKPLLKAQWKPRAAIVVSPYGYGKIKFLLNDITNVYYYNDGFFVIKGIETIDHL